MIVTLYKEPYHKTYYSSCCSAATWCCVLMYIGALSLPFLLVNTDRSLFKRDYEVFDDANLTFTGLVTFNVAEVTAFSTAISLYNAPENFASVGGLRLTSEVQFNQTSDIKLSLKILDPLTTDLSGTMYVFVNYTSNTFKKLYFTDVVKIPVYIPSDSSTIHIRGSIFLEQTADYDLDTAVSGGYIFDSQDLYYKLSFNEGATWSDRQSKIFKLGTNTNSFVVSNGNAGKEIKLTLRRQFNKVRKSPTVAEVIRQSWPSYFAFLLPILLIFRYILAEAFSFQLFRTSVVWNAGEVKIAKTL